MLGKTVLVFLVAIVYATDEKVRYDNYTVYKIFPNNGKDIEVLSNLQEKDFRYDFWSEAVPGAEFVDIMAAPADKAELEILAKDYGMKIEIVMSNVQDVIDKQKVARYTSRNIKSMGWDAYYNLNDINNWLDDLVATYPRIVTSIIGGSTYEGRQIKGIKISHGSGRKAVFLEGGIHAREWISPATVNFIAHELLTSNETDTVAAARDFDWYIFPVTNPDGYVWTFENERMWRKNRRPVAFNAIGIDLNRNWNNNWLRIGASAQPISDSYAGPGPFSEIETRTLSEYLRGIADQLELYLSFHSYSELLLLPFGNTTVPYANYNDALNIGRRAMGALSVRYGTSYSVGNIAEIIYAATGGSIDWVKDHLKVPLVYCYELRDKGQFGFMLPEDQILPNNQEVMDSVLDLIHQAKRFGYMSGQRRWP
ncbi:hypothetical protein JYU34_018495 [Plutella xylostella]|uniref:Peptidase M14 domain-containing protein n=1 Tax=Plutella xylostella TaxID=51655 RepID=A0ABQ7PXP4_PLUXY|nr:hypothetical protein JYU34_018495 [Plutella xylostella]